jgi:hypothetical protein
MLFTVTANAAAEINLFENVQLDPTGPYVKLKEIMENTENYTAS